MPSSKVTFQAPADAVWTGKQSCPIQADVVEHTENVGLRLALYCDFKTVVIGERSTNLLPMIKIGSAAKGKESLLRY